MNLVGRSRVGAGGKGSDSFFSITSGGGGLGFPLAGEQECVIEGKPEGQAISEEATF